MTGSHSRLSPSGAHRYTRCLGAPNAEHGIVDTAGFYAAEGTVYHDIAELCVSQGLDPHGFVGRVMTADGHSVAITEDVPRWLEAGLARIYELAEGAELHCESRVDLSSVLGPREGGRLDIGIVNWRHQEITVFDWKFGAGIPVTASWIDHDTADFERPNEQLALYAWGFALRVLKRLDWLTKEEWTVRLIIEQPRAAGGGGEYVLPLHLLEQEIHRISFLAAKTKSPDAPRTPGPIQCKFCKAKLVSYGGCKAHSDYVIDTCGLTDEDVAEGEAMDTYLVPVDRKTLPIERLAYIHRSASMLTAYLDDIQGYLLDRAKKGDEIPGMKMVRGRRPPRVYKDKDIAEAALVRLLKDEAYAPKEIISPAQAEKALGKDRYALELAKHVDQGQGGIALVSKSAKGEALSSSVDLLTDDDVQSGEI